MKTSYLLATCLSLGGATLSAQSLLPNGDFTSGSDGKDGWITYLNVFDPSGTTYAYGTSWDTGTATPLGGGALTLEAHPGWTDAGNGPLDLGNVIENNFYVDFGGTPAFAGQTVEFSGNFSVATPFDDGMTGVAFIKVLDSSWGLASFLSADVEASSGVFSITTDVPTGGINSFQVGFAMTGTAGDSGAMTVSDLQLVAVPEPSVITFLVGMAGWALLVGRRRR